MNTTAMVGFSFGLPTLGVLLGGSTLGASIWQFPQEMPLVASTGAVHMTFSSTVAVGMPKIPPPLGISFPAPQNEQEKQSIEVLRALADL